MEALRTERQKAAMTGSSFDGAREKDDFYPTPPELVHALLAVESFSGPIWEPACGDGAISRELEEAGHRVISTDLVDRGYGEPRRDFLMEHMAPAWNLVTNPPFKLAEQFWAHACTLAPGKVAFLCRLTWLESLKRAELFERFPLARVWVCPWRPRMQRGRQATKEDGGSMLAFAWYVRDHAHHGPTQLRWLKKVGK
jgi:hypothetical protein